MAMIPTFPFIAALRASIGGSSNSFVSLLYACGKYHSVSTKKSYGKTSYNFSVMQCTNQFEASTSPAVRAKPPPPHGEFKPYLGGVEIWTVGAVKSLVFFTLFWKSFAFITW